MTESLYQSGSVGIGLVRACTSALPFRPHAPDAVGRRRFQSQGLHLAVPVEGAAAEEILGAEQRIVGQAPFPERQLDLALLRGERIEADRDEQDVVARRRALGEPDDIAVAAVVE